VGESQSIEACAHHWWRRYLATDKPAEAYAAWVLFCGVADRRAWIWIQDEVDSFTNRDALLVAKLTHFSVNKNALEKAMDKREKKLNDTFLFQDIARGIGPWAR
jgi:hypothetical protein